MSNLKMSREHHALCVAYIKLKMLRDNALGPTARRTAEEGMETCIWGLGLEQYDGTIGQAPAGPVIEAARIDTNG